MPPKPKPLPSSLCEAIQKPRQPDSSGIKFCQTQIEMDRRGTVSGGKPENVNVPSELLKDHENREVFELIGKRCTTLSSAVVQLYMALPSSRDRWSKKFVGVATLVKDNPKRSYFIRLIDLVSRAMVWEQELYNHFVYTAARPYFHVFEADTCNIALNFASQKEADQFRSKVGEKLRSREQRRLDRKNQQTRKAPAPPSDRNALRPINGNQGDASPRSPSPAPSSGPNNYSKQPAEKKKSGGNKKDKNKKGKLSKADISLPSDFRHVGHVGWDPAGGFDINNIDPKWKKLFDSAGITEKELEDQDTSQFIYDFVEKHGGIDKATAEMESLSRGGPSSAAPPPPARSGHRRRDNAPPPPPPNRSVVPPPPPPSRGTSGAPQPPPPARGGPPPPPGRSVPPPPGRGPAGGGPPPPPPPPPVGGPPPPPPPGGAIERDQAPASGGGGRGDLLSAIHAGATLKKVDPDEKRRSTSGDGRGDLLAAIRAGTNLKTVSAEDQLPSPEPEAGAGGMAGALMKALQDRQKHIQSSDSETDSFSEGEGSWSD